MLFEQHVAINCTRSTKFLIVQLVNHVGSCYKQPNEKENLQKILNTGEEDIEVPSNDLADVVSEVNVSELNLYGSPSKSLNAQEENILTTEQTSH